MLDLNFAVYILFRFRFRFLLLVEIIDIIMPDNIQGTRDPKEVTTVILTFAAREICCSMEFGSG